MKNNDDLYWLDKWCERHPIAAGLIGSAILYVFLVAAFAL